MILRLYCRLRGHTALVNRVHRFWSAIYGCWFVKTEQYCGRCGKVLRCSVREEGRGE